MLAAWQRTQDVPAEDIDKHDKAELALDAAVDAYCRSPRKRDKSAVRRLARAIERSVNNEAVGRDALSNEILMYDSRKAENAIYDTLISSSSAQASS